ncbi:MAG: hypothetical protein FWF38_00485 [Spirochaetaceae bacterium]|nr:hypothetical protein [Spirochaetaceae bacterium]
MFDDFIFLMPDGTPPAASEPTPAEPPAYLSQLSPEFQEKSKDYFDAHPKLNDLAADYIKTKDSLKNAIMVPDPEKSTPEERSAFFKKMGIPESVDAYGTLEGEKESEAFAKQFKENILKHGLTKKQGIALWSVIKASAGEELKERDAYLKKQEADLPQKLQDLYGNDKGKADAALSRNKAFWVRLGSEDLLKDLNNAGILFNPAFVDFVSTVESQLGDNKLILGSGGQGKPKAIGRMGSNYHPDFAKEAGA